MLKRPKSRVIKALLSSFLIALEEIELENVSLIDVLSLRTVC